MEEQDISDLMSRLADVIPADATLEEVLGALDHWVAEGRCDDLLPPDRLGEWIDLVDGFLAEAAQEPQTIPLATLLCLAWVVQRQTARLGVLMPAVVEPTTWGAATWSLGAVLHRAGWLQEAADAHRAAAAAYGENYPLQYASCLINAGTALGVLGRTAEALPYFEEAAPLLQQHGTPADYASCQANTGTALLRLGRAAEALPYYLEAAPLLQQHGTLADYATCQMNRGNALAELGRAAEALPYYLEAAPPPPATRHPRRLCDLSNE